MRSPRGINSDIEELLDEAFNALTDGILIYSPDNIIIKFNKAFSDLMKATNVPCCLGMSRQEFLDGLRDSGTATYQQKTTQEWLEDQSEDAEEDDSNGEILSLPNGRFYLRRFRSMQNGGHIITVTDVTQIRKAHLKAEAAQIAKSEFLANMSHEIRTPMNGIMGMSQLLSNCKLGEREREFVQTIDRSSQALLTIINDILDFSKIEAGRVELDAEPFLLRESLEDVTSLLSTAATDTGIDLLLRIDPDIPEAYVGDVGRVRQVLTNLIGNALKFTHEGHVLIDVTASIIDKTAKLTIDVGDTGIGIAEDKLSNIFEKFSQADGSTTREYGGTGLGLTISSNLAHLMKGDITAVSELGKGSTFTFTCELGVVEDVAKPTAERPPNISGNILLIDDITLNHDILKEQLNSESCKCLSVESARKGLAVLAKAKDKNINIDLIIVDYQMPEMTGEGFIRIAKTHNDYAHIPILLFSSVDNDELKQRMKKLGVDGYLTKPARYQQLLRAVSKTILKSRKSVTAPHGVIDVTPVVHQQSLKTTQSKDGIIDVLIAEDNDVNQMFIKYIMEDMGVSFKIVPSGRLAVDKWKLLSPRIIFMDISMPDWNGYEATKAIREWEAKLNLPRTPIVAVTAHALKGDRQDCLDNDMDDYLSKPLAISGIEDMLDKWTDMTNLSALSTTA